MDSATITNNSLAHFNVSYLPDVQPFFIGIQIVVGFVTICGSITTLSLYYSVSSSSGIFGRKYFVALTLADLQEGIITSSLAIFCTYELRVNDPYCMEAIAVALHTIFVTLFLMFCMSIDRYLAIIHPLRYRATVTNTITVIAIVGSWIGGVLIGVLVYVTGDEKSAYPDLMCFVYTERTSLALGIAVVIFCFLPCFVVFVYVYVAVYKVVLDSMKSLDSTSTIMELGKIAIRKNTKSNLEAVTVGGIKTRDIRSTLILFITIILFLLTYLPGITLLVMFEIFPDKISLQGALTCYVVSQMNSMFSPFLYMRNIPNASKVIKSWFKCGTKKIDSSTSTVK